MKMGTVAAAIAACVALFTVVSPAVGGPSVSRVAKKALKYGKAANKRSKSAVKTAKAAKRSADSGVQAIEVESGDVPAPPQDFARFDVKCPSGYVAMGPSMGLGALEPVSVLNYGNGYLGSYYNPSPSSFYTGGLAVQCAIGYQVTRAASATRSKAEAARDLAKAEREHRTTH